MERIDTDYFVPLALNLPVGQSMRADHDCIGVSEGTLMITRAVGKLTAYCFRCGAKGWHVEQESLPDKLARMNSEREADAHALRTMQLPEPRVYTLADWPRNAALWLYKAGFSPSMIDDLGAYWCPALGRVVLPIMVDDQAIFWQARSITRQPKILSPNLPRQGVVAKYGKGDTLVLCEDTLSAYKVGRETEAWSLLGTKLLPQPLADILADGRPVIVWLDSDHPGRVAAKKIIKTLRAYGVQVRDVVTKKDPKLYDRAFIQEVLRA
jgi:Toprim domain-containing protein